MKHKLSTKKIEKELEEMPVGICLEVFKEIEALIKIFDDENSEDKNPFNEIEGDFTQAFQAFTNALLGEQFKEYNPYSITLITDILKSLPEIHRKNLLESYDLFLEINSQILVSDKKDDEYQISKEDEDLLEKKLNSQLAIYNLITARFTEFDLGEEPYKTLIRHIFSDSLESAEEFIHNENDSEETEFGFELKNITLIMRSKLKQVSQKGDSFNFVKEYLQLLSDEEKRFFVNEHVSAYIDKVEMDIEDNLLESQKELDYYSMALKLKDEISKDDSI